MHNSFFRINMEKLDEYVKIKIEDKRYCMKSLQNFRLELENFMGYFNIILPKAKKHYRFFYRGGVKEDSFLFHNPQSFIFYFEGVRDISSFRVIPENHHRSKYIHHDDLFFEKWLYSIHYFPGPTPSEK